MNSIIEFVDSFIPSNLPSKRKQILKDELMCHILDKADYYQELGFGERQSIEKAIDDFGTDEEMKKFIFGEFESLYQERTVWGILAGLFIWLLNWLCIPLDIWVYSADYNREPDPAGALVSFIMIFAVLGLIVFARIKKYRKMLLCIGISNLTVIGGLLWFFYPQMAMYSLIDNIVYLIDRFTPFLFGNTLLDVYLYIFFIPVLFTGISLYTFIASRFLKTGRIGDVKNPKKKSIVFASIFVFIMISTCFIQPSGRNYVENYPVWFSPYNVYISDQTADFYEGINIGDTKERAEEILKGKGFISFQEYSSHLDRLRKKQFDANTDEFMFIDGYTVYFHPEIFIPGEGFVGIKYSDGIVTGVAVGNIGKYMYDEEYETFGYFENYDDISADISEVKEYFSLIKKGEREDELLNPFSYLSAGDIYAKRKYTENGSLKTYYRIYFYGVLDPEEADYRRDGNCYIELLFSDGALEKGKLFTEDFDANIESQTVSDEI